MFASLTQSDPIPIPFDPPHTVTVRKLTGRECEIAAVAHRDGIASGSARAWPATFRRMLEKGASDPEVLKAIADPLLGYDRYAVVRAGLIAWTYPQSIAPPLTKGAGVDAVEDLDDEGVDFIAREILKLTKPALFHVTEADAEDAKKNG